MNKFISTAKHLDTILTCNDANEILNHYWKIFSLAKIWVLRIQICREKQTNLSKLWNIDLRFGLWFARSKKLFTRIFKPFLLFYYVIALISYDSSSLLTYKTQYSFLKTNLNWNSLDFLVTHLRLFPTGACWEDKRSKFKQKRFTLDTKKNISLTRTVWH